MDLIKALVNVVIISVSAGPVMFGTILYGMVQWLRNPGSNEYEIASKAGKKMRDIFYLITFK